MPKIFNPDGSVEEVEHINGYLLPGPDIYIKPRSTPLSRAVPPMITGNMPNDGGNLILAEEEKNILIKKCPQSKKFIKQLIGAEEFINKKNRYCLWLVDCQPDELRKMKLVYERVKAVKEFRLKSSRAATRKLAETPHLFGEIRQPKTNCIVVPVVSSSRRRYVPMDYIDENIICTDRVKIIPNAEVWHFGILTSKVHMAWMRAVCGRLRNDYNYSAKIVYNNFVWVKMEFIDYAELILAAEKILKVRKNYPNASLADLYDEVTMPKDLRDAHKNLDRIVLRMYHYDEDMTEEEIAINLLEHYKFVIDYLTENKLKQLTRRNSEDDEDFDEE